MVQSVGFEKRHPLAFHALTIVVGALVVAILGPLVLANPDLGLPVAGAGTFVFLVVILVFSYRKSHRRTRRFARKIPKEVVVRGQGLLAPRTKTK